MLGFGEKGWSASCWEVGRESYCLSPYKVRTDRPTLLQESLLLSVGKHLLLFVRVVSPLYCGLITELLPKGPWGPGAATQ